MAVVDTTAASPLGGEVERAVPGTRFARVRRQLGIALPAGVMVLILLLCFLGPWVLPIPKPTGGDVLHSNLSVGSPGHLLGTDPDGNDIFSRLLYGGRASLEIALSVTVLGLFIGGSIGAISGYLAGGLDTLLMRILDVFIAFPSLVLTLAVAQSLGANLQNTVIALAFFSIPAFARVARGATLQLRERPFMDAAELCGTARWRILLRHVAPNIGPQLISFALLGVGIIIVISGALSFLGLGVQAPAPSWGNMIYQGQQTLTATPTLVLWPSITLLITVLACNLFGENLRSRWSGG
jgi:peptide/nickel transport system permease protein